MKDNIQGTSIGYAINLIMDYGNGRQVTISGTLPLGANLTDMNSELDKLRKATNRQSAFVNLREIENTTAMAKKTVAALETILVAYDKEMEAEMAKISSGENSNRTLVKSQLENMRTQALNYKLTKNEELMRARGDIEKGEMLIEKLNKEIKDIGD